MKSVHSFAGSSPLEENHPLRSLSHQIARSNDIRRHDVIAQRRA